MEKVANDNLAILIQKLFLNKKLAEEFSKCKTLDDFYSFCTSIQDGYTKEELKNTLDMLGNISWKKLNSITESVDDNDLEMVAGGVNFNNLPNKITAGILSLLSLFFSVFPSNINAASVNNREKQSSYTANSFFEKIKTLKNSRAFKCLASAAGAALVIGTTIFFSRRLITPNKLGLSNPGNACYINATLQQLYSISEFRMKVMNDKSGDKKIEALKTIFKSLDSGKPLDKLVRNKALETIGYSGVQEDSYDFLTTDVCIGPVLEKFDLSVDTVPLSPKEYSSVKDYFSDIKNLNTISMTRDQIFLPFNMRPCEANIMEEKFGAPKKAGTSVKRKNFDVSKEVEVFGEKKHLTGAIVKVGSPGSGHYYSYKVMSDGQWYCFNDSSVFSVSEEEMMRDVQENARCVVYSS